MSGIITNHKLLEERAWRQSEGLPIEHSQMSLDKYLDRLNFSEREGLIKLIRGIWRVESEYFRKEINSFSVFGVGTITYDDNYWTELEAYLKKDPSKKKHVENKGEDIDLLFCPEHCGRTGRLTNDYRIEYAKRFNNKKLMLSSKRYNTTNFPQDDEIFYLRKKIKNKINNNLKLNEDEEFIWKSSYDFKTIITGASIEEGWKHTEWTDEAPFGTHYFNVPTEFIEKEKQSIVRTKGKEYGKENMTINIPGCRTFHIYIDEVLCTSHKIEYERNINIPFTIIYRPRTYSTLEKAIEIKNGTYVLKQKIDPKNRFRPDPDEIPF